MFKLINVKEKNNVQEKIIMRGAREKCVG